MAASSPITKFIIISTYSHEPIFCQSQKCVVGHFNFIFYISKLMKTTRQKTVCNIWENLSLCVKPLTFSFCNQNRIERASKCTVIFLKNYGRNNVSLHPFSLKDNYVLKYLFFELKISRNVLISIKYVTKMFHCVFKAKISFGEV